MCGESGSYRIGGPKVASLYPAADYGFFFGGGRKYWLPAGATLADYLGTQRGLWLALTAALMIGGLTAIRRRASGHPAAADEIVVTCAGLHAAFVCLFFAGEVSWQYYAYLPTMGVAALAARRGRWAVVVAVLAVSALLVTRTLPREVSEDWKRAGPGFRIDGTMFDPDGRHAEWRAVLRRIEGEDAVLVAMSGCAEVLHPELQPAVTLFLLGGMQDWPDARRKAEQIRSAEFVVVPRDDLHSSLLGFPALRLALAPFRLDWQGRFFAVYRRQDQPVETLSGDRMGRRDIERSTASGD